MKYSTKDQNDIENPWALHLNVFDKTNSGLSGENNDAAIGLRRIQSMCCTLSNPHEVSAPMACLYLIRGSAFYSSHKFVKIPLTSVLAVMFKQHGELSVVLEGDTRWERKKSKKGIKFLPDHALYASHSLFQCSVEKVVTLCQKRLPDMRRSDLSPEERLRYQRSLFVLFRPFKSPKSLSRTFTLPNYGVITRMGIPQGVTELEVIFRRKKPASQIFFITGDNQKHL
ncbi:hypothetical protein F442_22754 [Phytophthora nicotianae P10297]|uniref:Uncharacterized protein n=1 Tax=Phytophthora nicotianae P10297 TaxID=1317064 RepID=W2XZ22_PHYNI|nr:hypothetical protein F442_22754 [Phytophthora nicotianae P10297]